MNKAPIDRLRRVALVRTLHQRGVNKRRTPDPGQEQVELSRSIKTFVSSYPDPWGTSIVYANGEDQESDLRSLRAYKVVPDESLEPGDLHVVDEKGEDHVYTASSSVTGQDLERQRFAF